jgi:hypothetical protein
MAPGFKASLLALILLGVASCLHALQAPVPPVAENGKFFEDRIEIPNSAAPLTAAKIVSLLGNPQPFVLEVVEQRYIAIYCRAAKFTDCDSELLAKIKSDVSRLASKPAEKPKPASIAYEYTVPHARALGDVAAAANGLHFSALKIEAVGNDKIRVSKAAGVSDQEFKNQREIFEKDLDHLAWQIEPESPVARVYYVDSAPAADVLNAKAPAPSQAPAPVANLSDQKSKGQTPPPDNTPKADQPARPAAKGAAKPATPKGGGKAGGGSAKAPKVGGGAGAPNAKGKGPAVAAKSDTAKDSNSGAQQQPKQADAEKPPANPNPRDGQAPPESTPGNQSKNKGNGDQNGGDKSGAPAAIAITAFNPDLIVFADKNRGDDSEIAERKRILAGIDFPRPEVIINTFSFQMSSSNSVALANHDRILRTRIGTYNDSIQEALYRAWFYLEQQMAVPGFFDPTFYNYLTKRFVGLPRPLSVVPITTEGEPAAGSDSKKSSPAKPSGSTKKCFNHSGWTKSGDISRGVIDAHRRRVIRLNGR